MIVDILVGAVLLVSAVIAFLRGFIREVLTIAGVVGGLAAAYIGGPFFSVYVHDWMGISKVTPEGEEPQRLFDIVPYTLIAEFMAYGAIFIVVMIILSVLSHLLAEMVKSVGLGAIDRSLGVVFGVARGALLLGLLYLPLYVLLDGETKERWFAGSNTHIYLEKTSALIGSFLPSETLEDLEDDARQLGDAVTTRQKLEEMQVLRRKAEEGELSEEEQQKLHGYDQEFRENMDRLFEQEAEGYNE